MTRTMRNPNRSGHEVFGAAASGLFLSRVGATVSFLALIIFASIAVALQPAYAALALCVVVLLVVGIARPEVGLGCAVLGPFFIRPLGEDLMHLSQGIVTAVAPSFAGVALIGFLLRPRRASLGRRVDAIHALIAAFVMVGVASAVANHTLLPVAVESLRSYAVYFVLLFAVATSRLDSRWFVRMVWLLVAAVAVQLPVLLRQVAINARPSGLGSFTSTWDTRVGTLGAASTGVLGVVAPMVACLLVGIACETKSRLMVCVAVAFCMEVFIDLVISEAKFGVLVFPVALLITVCVRVSMRRVTIFAVSAVVGWGILQAVAPLVIPGSPLIDNIRNPASALQYFSSNGTANGNGAGFSRGNDIAFSWQLLSGDVGRELLGYGPGAATGSSVDSTLNGPLWDQYGYRPGFAAEQVPSALLEYGVLGILIYSACVVLCLRWAVAIWKQADASPAWRGSAVGFPGALFIYLVGAAYLKDWNVSVVACTFWFLAGALYSTAPQPQATEPVLKYFP